MKMYRYFYSSWSQTCGVRETDGRSETKTDCYIDPSCLQAGTESRLTLTPTALDPHVSPAYITSSRRRFPINHVIASGYLHRSVLFREISD